MQKFEIHAFFPPIILVSHELFEDTLISAMKVLDLLVFLIPSSFSILLQQGKDSGSGIGHLFSHPSLRRERPSSSDPSI